MHLQSSYNGTNQPGARLRKLYSRPAQKLCIRTSDGIYCISIDKILYCEASGNYCLIHTRAGERPVLVSKTLKCIETYLPGAEFARCHQSYVVRLDEVAHVDERVLLENGKSLPMSRRRRGEFLGRLNDLLIVI